MKFSSVCIHRQNLRDPWDCHLPHPCRAVGEHQKPSQGRHQHLQCKAARKALGATQQRWSGFGWRKCEIKGLKITILVISRNI